MCGLYSAPVSLGELKLCAVCCFFSFSQTGFIQVNDIYQWKSTFAINAVTISITKLVVITMADLNTVYLAMALVTMVEYKMH